jgi:ssDNA-binding Zn-finger/Zn-ribbon topoisomerase 1
MLVKFMDEYVAVPFTGEMEEELDVVAEGERGYLSVVREFWPKFDEKLQKAEGEAEKNQEETDILCDVCGQANLVIKWGRNGKFFACPRYPDCKNSMPMDPETGEPVRVAQPVRTEYACPKCGRPTVQKTGPYGPYLDCTGRDDKKCDFRAGVPVGVACPEEPETGQLVEKQAIRRGGKSVFTVAGTTRTAATRQARSSRARWRRFVPSPSARRPTGSSSSGARGARPRSRSAAKPLGQSAQAKRSGPVAARALHRGETLLLERVQVRLQVEVVAPGADLAVVHLKDTHARQIDMLATAVRPVDPLCEHDVAGRSEVQHLPIRLLPVRKEPGDSLPDGLSALDRRSGHVVIDRVRGEVSHQLFDIQTGPRSAEVADELVGG